MGILKARVLLATLLLLAALWLCASTDYATVSAQAGHFVDVLTVTGAIDTWNASYISRGIGLAERGGAQALIIVLDTPGGTLGAMQKITTAMLAARVPVVVYVSPAGAWAGSAGTFVTLASHIAAMAPGTAIGAAHPVDSSGQDIAADERAKVTSFSVASIQAIAAERGRNAEWAAHAVSDSVSAMAQEAVDLHVVDLMAVDLDDLLRQIDGRTVETRAGTVVLETAPAAVVHQSMNVAEIFFHTLVDPNLALVLLSIGMLAVSVELYSPGAILPGVVGGISLVLAFVALGNLPVNWGGVILITLAIVCFLLDIKVAGFGLTVAGLVMFVLGALMLFTPVTPPHLIAPAVRVSPVVALSMGGMLAAFFLFVLGAAMRSRRLPVVSGRQALVGAVGITTTPLTPDGQVQVRGERWSAVAQGEAIAQGETVVVVAVEGLRLSVVKQDVAGR